MELSSLSEILLLISLIQTGHAQVNPTPHLSVEPNLPQIFSGETVTLRCDIPGHPLTDWKYVWETANSQSSDSDENYYTIKDIKVNQSLKYRCYGSGKRSQPSSEWSNEVILTVIERPKTSLILSPTGQIVSGDTVTLTCQIKGHTDTEWRYYWYKDDDTENAIQYYDSKNQYSFTLRNSGKYTCRGQRWSDFQRSEISDAVTLTLSAESQAVLSVSPQSWLTEGDSVTLSCKVRNSSGWIFKWYKAVPYRPGLTQIKDSGGYLKHSVELLPNSSRGSGGSYTLSSAGLHHTGVYWCRAEKGEIGQYSNPQPLWITGLSPPASLINTPSRSQHFYFDSLSLSCEGQSKFTGWKVRRYTYSKEVSVCSSGWGSATGSTCNISSLYTSHTGVYWCESESGGSSNPVNITVHNGAVILESPDYPVTEGDPVTLRCLYHGTKPSDLTADFYKDGLLIQTQTAGEMTIPAASKSDEGLYYCKHPDKGKSPQSWISVKGSGVRSAVGVSFGIYLVLLFLIILTLLWLWKDKKDVGDVYTYVTYSEIDLKMKEKANDKQSERNDTALWKP